MMHIAFTGLEQFSYLISEVERWSQLRDFQIDMQPLGDLIAQQIIEENRALRLGGLDKDGAPMVDILLETAKRRARAGKGAGPPLDPDGDSSRVISNLFVRLRLGENSIHIEVGWKGIPWLRYHAEGAGRLPVRDILGFPEETDQWILDVFNEYVRLRVWDYLQGEPARAPSVADLPMLRKVGPEQAEAPAPASQRRLPGYRVGSRPR